jgi:hypothetical protein
VLGQLGGEAGYLPLHRAGLLIQNIQRQSRLLAWSGVGAASGGAGVVIGLVALGVAMRSTPAFERRSGLAIGLGVVGVLAAPILLAGPSEVAIIMLLAVIIFHLVLGWRVFSLSKAP